MNMMKLPRQIDEVVPVQGSQADHVLLVSASWERRCLGVPQRLSLNYRCEQVLLSSYQRPSELREEMIRQMVPLLERAGPIQRIYAEHDHFLHNVRQILNTIASISFGDTPRITIDVSCFTKKHLLTLVHGLESRRLLSCTQFLFTVRTDYDTTVDEAVSSGVANVELVPSFTGDTSPSLDSVLILFLGFEATRALALWSRFDATTSVAVIAEPPYLPEWQGLSEQVNRKLVAELPDENLHRCDSLDPAGSESLLERLIGGANPGLYQDRKNVFVAPLGPKAQALGVYRYWRRFPRRFSIVYASPGQFRERQTEGGCGNSWLLDCSIGWQAPASE